nr:hypothetical protein Iba_chr15bCG8480 [Ipomoea batatas]
MPALSERDPAAALHVVDVQKKRPWLGSSPERSLSPTPPEPLTADVSLYC